MKLFTWDPEKNKMLKKKRGVSFEHVVFAIENEQLLDVLEHPNPEKYKGQRLYLVEIENYAYIVPYIDHGDERVLKTIFPSRKYTKLYLWKE